MLNKICIYMYIIHVLINCLNKVVICYIRKKKLIRELHIVRNFISSNFETR